jgi:hypothetical protein
VSLEAQILKSSAVVAAKNQVWCELIGEAVILHLKSGNYYGLNPVGSRIWHLIQEVRTVGAVLETLLEEYDVAPERCEADLFSLLQNLAANELIVIEPGRNGADTPHDPFVSPR